jgi:SAM-dependent methyltransferase
MWSQKFQTAWPLLEPSYRSEGGHPVSAEKFHNIAQMIVRLARIAPADTVYDLGCSIGTITKCLSRHCRHITGVDFLQTSIDFAKTHSQADKIDYVCADLTQYSIVPPANVIIINNLIHCVDSWSIAKKLLRNSFAALNPGGRLYLGEVPDIQKISRSNLSTKKRLTFNIHRHLPSALFPLLGRITRRPLDRMLLYSQPRLARILDCPINSIATHSDSKLLLNPIDRSHFVIQKSR